MDYIDMHTHSNASDGALSAKELIDFAINQGLRGISITDHDTVAGIQEAQEYARSLKDFWFLPGVELSTEFLNEEVHILGYNIDSNFQELLSVLEEMQNHRKTRARKMIDKLKAIGIDISFDEVRALARGVIGRPHIGEILINKGYAKNMEEVFAKYLKVGGAAYVPRYKLTPMEAIRLIKKAGGIPILAHPGLIKNQEIVEMMIPFGLEGIEVYYPKHNDSQIKRYLHMVEVNNLIYTGGSDFHSIPNNTNRGYNLGSYAVSLPMIKTLIAKANENKIKKI